MVRFLKSISEIVNPQNSEIRRPVLNQIQKPYSFLDYQNNALYTLLLFLLTNHEVPFHTDFLRSWLLFLYSSKNVPGFIYLSPLQVLINNLGHHIHDELQFIFISKQVHKEIIILFISVNRNILKLLFIKYFK